MPDAESNPASSPSELWLIEDSDEDATLFVHALAAIRPSWHVVRLSTGEEAIRFFEAAMRKSALPAAIFVDLELPGMRGVDVLEWIQKQPVFETTKLFVISGHVKNSVYASLGGARNVWFCPKPTSSFGIAAGLSLEELL
jgi:CheY-like chemotaxis protein